MPSGSYCYLKSWLSSQIEEEIKVPQGAVKIVFDNEQKLSAKGILLSHLYIPFHSSVITSHIYISIDVDNSLQNELKPRDYMLNGVTAQQSAQFFNFPNALATLMS